MSSTYQILRVKSTMAAEKKAKKRASKPAGPSSFAKVCEAIKAKKHARGGVSRPFIYKHIGDNHSGTQVAAVRRAISKAVADGFLEVGATKQRFKLTDAGKQKIAPPKPKKKKKAVKKKKASKKKRKKTVKRKSSKKKKAKKRTSKRKSAKRKSAKRRPAKRSSKKKTKKRTSKKRRAAAKK